MVNRQQTRVGIRDHDEARGGGGLNLGGLVEVMIGMKLGGQPPVRGNDALAVDRLREAENLEQSGRVGGIVAGIVVEEGRPAPPSIRLGRPAIPGMIDVIECEAMPETEEGVGLEAERKVQLQNRRVLCQRDRTVLIDNRCYRLLEQECARLTRGQLSISLTPAGDVDAGDDRRHPFDRTQTSFRRIRGISSQHKQVMDDRGGDQIAARSGGNRGRLLGARNQDGEAEEDPDDKKAGEQNRESDDLHG